ncbi:MAG: class I SAM-dependent methyltransferase [Pyrinomonadaceae bacterium]|nr:class I SAM-dependent methyltransferase [Pyrinomonadaceae bacterium]
MIRRLFNRIINKKKQQEPLVPETSFKGFIKEISPNDSMYQADNLYYFYWGKWALDCVEKTLEKAGKREINKILDFPCGHGRALRFFKTAFPEATLTACDIEKDGVDFCAKTFGARGVYSSKNPSELSIEEKFDLIWCGSLLTHLNQHKWREFLRFFDKHLKNNGVLIITTHGDCIANSLRKGNEKLGLEKRAIEKLLLDYQKIGFGYTDYMGQNNYGVSLSQSGWVIEFLKEFSNLQLIEHNPKGWGSKIFSQDSFALIWKE